MTEISHDRTPKPQDGRPAPLAQPARRTLIYVVSEDWYFLSHRLPMARAARDLGFRVIVATRMDKGRDAIEAEGFAAVDIPMDRGSLSPSKEMAAVWALLRLFRKERPAIIHNIALKPILHGSFAAYALPGTRIVNSVTGLGWVASDQARESPVKRLVFTALKRYAQSPSTTTIVQNDDDRDLLTASGLAVPERLVMIRGSGVDTDRFTPSPEPEDPVALMVARLLLDKGVTELVDAARILRDRNHPLKIRIAGDVDPANPNSLTAAQIEAWHKQGLVEFLGARSDIPDLLRQAQIAVLPSYREGMPKSLLEAAASGRPMVTTDVPGCRDLVPDGKTGRLVPPRDPVALADALMELADSAALRKEMGDAARALVMDRFSGAAVTEQTRDLYSRLVTV